MNPKPQNSQNNQGMGDRRQTQLGEIRADQTSGSTTKTYQPGTIQYDTVTEGRNSQDKLDPETQSTGSHLCAQMLPKT